MFEIGLAGRARDALDTMRKYDRQKVLETIQNQLSHQPAQETRNRKRLRPNQLAQYELRVGSFRVFYDVVDDESLVKVLAIGYKEGSKLFVPGKENEL